MNLFISGMISLWKVKKYSFSHLHHKTYPHKWNVSLLMQIHVHVLLLTYDQFFFVFFLLFFKFKKGSFTHVTAKKIPQGTAEDQLNVMIGRI